MKRILILYTSVGLGHKSIAENIGWHLAQAGFQVKLADIRSVQRGNFEQVVVKVHQWINKSAPFLWGWLYRWGHYIILPFRVFIAGFNYRKTFELLKEYQPDAVITTQTSASAVIAYLKKRRLYTKLFGIAFSDYHFHPYWYYPQADFYLANIQEQEQRLVKKGVAANNIAVCGITLRPQEAVDADAIRQRLNIPPSHRVVLVGTGSLGIGFKFGDLADLAGLPKVSVIFACGRNEALKAQISKLHYPHVIPLGFYQPMDELYAISDVMVGKPGGLTTAEILRYHLPLIVTFTLPGQEELNVTFLAQRKLVVPWPKNLAQAIGTELENHAFRRQLGENSQIAEIVGNGKAVVEELRKVLA